MTTWHSLPACIALSLTFCAAVSAKDSSEHVPLALASNTTTTSSVEVVSIGIFAPGYVLCYIVACGIILAHLVHMIRRQVVFSKTSNVRAKIAEDMLSQTGYKACMFGRGVRISALLFVAWLQIAIILAIVGHYEGIWIFDMSVPAGSVDWDSYTRVFLMAWSTSILAAVFSRVFQDRLRTFYMMPVPLESAEYVKMTQTLVDSSDPRGNLSVVHTDVVRVGSTPIRHIDFLLRRYVWSDPSRAFSQCEYFSKSGPTGNEVHAVKRINGMSRDTVLKRLAEFGTNEIVLTIPSLPRMVVDELTSFFYLYQIFACWLPFFWDYITMGFLALTLVLASALVKILMERKQKLLLQNMATLHGSVWAKRDGIWTSITSQEVVVGDLVCWTASDSLSSRETLVDCLIVSGHAIIDEASLTGETMPIQKFVCPVDDHNRHTDQAEHRKYFLFAGTTILQTGGAAVDLCPPGVTDGTLAVVTATGARTSRGQLMRGLIFGANLKSTLFVQLRYSLAILILIAVIDFFSLNARFHMSLSSMLTAMYSIVGLINPLMAVSLVAGELKSANRLKTDKTTKVFTRDLHRLTLSGRVNLALLDKTGTITKSGLDFFGAVAADTLQMAQCDTQFSRVSPALSSAIAMAHTVSRCGSQLIGHQVELRMVETAERLGWRFSSSDMATGIVDPTGAGWEVDTVFPFSHETMTMSALVRKLAVEDKAKRTVLCKGSFEALKLRCTHGVTIEVEREADKFAKQGCYVLGVAVKDIEGVAGEIEREVVESDLTLVGLLLFRNEEKADSKSAIAELQAAGVQVKMLTGDSVFTGASVARSVGIIPADATVAIATVASKSKVVEWRLSDTNAEISAGVIEANPKMSLCVTGEAFAILSAQGKLNLEAVAVFGRVSPNQKAEIVRMYTVQAEKVVAMCGDGANDSSSLRAAHAGLALSGRTEASISAPFSTDSDSLTALSLLIRESRAALCTSLASYQTLVVVGILYCISKSVLLFQAEAYQAGLSYLYLDLITTPIMLYSLVNALPAKKLASNPPEGRLLGTQVVVTAAWSVVVCIAFLALADLVMVKQGWFVAFQAGPGVGLEDWQERGNDYEAALIFLWSAWVYVDVPLTYAAGGIHRAPIWTNWKLVVSASVLFGITLAVMFVKASTFGCYFKVACSEYDSNAASDSFINHFLFPYEKVGGPWYNDQITSTEFPAFFKATVFIIFLSMSACHHVGHYYITHQFVPYLKRKFGWTGFIVPTKTRNAGKEELTLEEDDIKEIRA